LTGIAAIGSAIVVDKTLEQIDEELMRLEAERQQVIDKTREDAVKDVKEKIRRYKITNTELRGVLPKSRRKRRGSGSDK
jgi:hypothetical protein